MSHTIRWFDKVKYYRENYYRHSNKPWQTFNPFYFKHEDKKEAKYNQKQHRLNNKIELNKFKKLLLSKADIENISLNLNFKYKTNGWNSH